MKSESIKQLEQYGHMLKQSGLDVVPCSLAASQNVPSHQVDISAETGRKESWLGLRKTVLQCVQCSELASTRKTVVFGSGNANAKLVFVGEAPGFEEDVQGLPFVGRAGQLLTKMIEAIGFSRNDVFICNVLKCRPPGNRNPLPAEILNCQPYLTQQLDIIRPKVICALGSFAARTLLKSGAPISQLRGKTYDYGTSKLICTFHPAYLLRNPDDKRKAWEDLKKVRNELSD